MSIADKLRNLTREELTEALGKHPSFSKIIYEFGGHKDKFYRDILIEKLKEFGLDYSKLEENSLKFKPSPPVQLVCICGKSYTRTQAEYNKNIKRTGGKNFCSRSCANVATNTIDKLRFIDESLIKQTISESNSFFEILTKLGCKNQGGNVRIAKVILQERGIDYTKIPSGKGHNKGQRNRFTNVNVVKLLEKKPCRTFYGIQVSNKTMAANSR